MTDVNYSDQQPQLIRSSWNRLAIVAFVFPIAVFVLAQVVGFLLPKAVVPDGAATSQIVAALAGRAILTAIIELVVYAVGVVLGHVSLTRSRRVLRGRGFGIAGVILGYLGIVISILGIVSVLVLPSLLQANGM